MKRLTNAEKLSQRREHSPSAVLYWILMKVVAIINKSVNTSFIYKAHPAEEKGPIVLVSNHASRMDYLFTAPVCYPKRLNYVVGYNEFYRFPTNLLLRMAQVIPKKNFTPDVHCIRSIHRVVSEGGNICIMPEGMSSITGMAQPVMPGTGKLVKSLRCPVYYTKIAGGYLTFTKHFLDKRKGRIEVTVDKMFSPEDLALMSPEQIEDRMNELLAHDDYIWNESAQVLFEGDGHMAEKLDTLLYMCPKCGTMYDMNCEGNVMRCNHCGNTVSLDASGLSFEGSLRDKTLSFSIPIQSLPTFGMCTDISRFYTFLEGKFLEFYPEGKDALRWMHLVEEMHRAHGGKWQNVSYRHFQP